MRSQPGQFKHPGHDRRRCDMQDEATIALSQPPISREEGVHDAGVDELGVDQRDHESSLRRRDGIERFSHGGHGDKVVIANQTYDRHVVDVIGLDRSLYSVRLTTG